MGDSGLEILHGGVGGDVELGARTSKQILLLAFDPLVSFTLSLYICASIISYKHHSFIAYITYSLLVLPCIFHIAIHLYLLGLIVCVNHIAISLIAWIACVCVPNLYSSNKSFT